LNSIATLQDIEAIYRQDSRKAFATLVRLFGDFDLAEDALHDAFRIAIERWPVDGIPGNPVAWLVSTGRFKAIDAIRRRKRLEPLSSHAEQLAAIEDFSDQLDSGGLEDERLRLIFTCCHPSISADAQVALTLREGCGLTTEEIARAFLTPAPTLAQRIVRAKAKIRDAKIPFALPEPDELPERLSSVLRVAYLVFNEGYSSTAGESLHRSDLTQEAIRLARLLNELLPEPETEGLLALMLLHEARRNARVSEDGDLIILEEQDRNLWDRRLIAEGRALAQRSLNSGRFGSYTLQAAISSVHLSAASYEETRWSEIVSLYEVLFRMEPGPIVALNLAVAVAMRDGPQAGIPQIEALIAQELRSYHLAHAARAYLYRLLGNDDEARASYSIALELARQEPERRFLARKLADLAQS
jgi:RNA polymerase sigma-70 factor (ECF subfamily)